MFFGEGLGDGAAIVSRPGALMRDLVAPQERLAVALGQRGEGPAGPERIADIANGALYAPLLIPGADLTRARDEMIVGA